VQWRDKFTTETPRNYKKDRGRAGRVRAGGPRSNGLPYPMKYLLNVPLALAALLQAWFVSLVLMPGPWPGWSDGPSRGAMVLVMLQPVILSWLLLAPVIVGAVFAGGFDWLRVQRWWLRLTLVLGAFLLIAILAAPCIFIAIGISAAVADSDTRAFGSLAVWSAVIAATLAPLVLMGWLAWVINAPPTIRGALLPGAAGLAALLLTVVTGGILGTPMLLDEIASERATTARYRQMEDENNAAAHAYFAKLTDADPLRNWIGYTDRFTPDDIRQAALRRLAIRPTLEPDLVVVLGSSEVGSSSMEWTDQAFLAVAAIPFQPSAALEAPLRRRIGRLAEVIRTVRRPEADSDYDTYVDRWFDDRLAAALVISRKMAQSAGVDLSDSLHDLQSAIIEAYPKSNAAKTYPGQVAAAAKQIEAAVAARRQRG
jgi:hypothetical protein